MKMVKGKSNRKVKIKGKRKDILFFEAKKDRDPYYYVWEYTCVYYLACTLLIGLILYCKKTHEYGFIHLGISSFLLIASLLFSVRSPDNFSPKMSAYVMILAHIFVSAGISYINHSMWWLVLMVLEFLLTCLIISLKKRI